MPLEDVQALAAGATRVRINSRGGGPSDSVVSTANSWPIEDVRLGRTIATARTLTSAQASTVWSGTRVSHMVKTCIGTAGGLDTTIYHACSNGQGLHWGGCLNAECSTEGSGWTSTSTEELELYIDATVVPILRFLFMFL